VSIGVWRNGFGLIKDWGGGSKVLLRMG
jgi:hypothetical protein